MHILRDSWRLLLGLMVLTALVSLVLALMRPPTYQATTTLLVTRIPGVSSAGMTPGGEDKAALDLPAIMAGRTFQSDLLAEVQQRRPDIQPSGVLLRGMAEERRLTLEATAARPEAALLVVEAATDLIKANGLRYWGDPTAGPGQPGLNVAVLDAPASVPLKTPRAIALDVVMRAIAALLLGCGVLLLLSALRIWPAASMLRTQSEPINSGNEQ